MPQPLAPRGVQAGIPGTRLSSIKESLMKWGKEVVIWEARGSSDPELSALTSLRRGIHVKPLGTRQLRKQRVLIRPGVPRAERCTARLIRIALPGPVHPQVQPSPGSIHPRVLSIPYTDGDRSSKGTPGQRPGLGSEILRPEPGRPNLRSVVTSVQRAAIVEGQDTRALTYCPRQALLWRRTQTQPNWRSSDRTQ